MMAPIVAAAKFGARLVARMILLFPLLPVLYCLEPFRKIRFGILYTQRIGHLAGNTEIFLRRRQLVGVDPKIVCVFAGWDPANRQLMHMYGRLLPIYESRWLTWLLFTWRPILARTRFYEPFDWSHTKYAEFNRGRASLAFTAEEEQRGRVGLAAMGIGAEEWFVCWHVRDAAYLQAWRPQYNDLWRSRDFRNCRIENYFEAIADITRRGGYVVRMGSVVESPLPDLGDARVIDYAVKHRSDFMDIYLPAKCRFFLASDSGLHMVAEAFDVPVAMANQIYLRANPFRSDDLFIPKLIYDTEAQRHLSFREALDLGFYDDGREPPQTERFVYQDNDADDILDMVRETFSRLDGGPMDPETKRLSELYRERFMSDLPDYRLAGRLCGAFAKKHRHLLELGHEHRAGTPSSRNG